MTEIERIIEESIKASANEGMGADPAKIAKAIEQYVEIRLLEKDVYWSGSNKKLRNKIAELKKGLE